jgi:hypothetical protein
MSNCEFQKFKNVCSTLLDSFYIIKEWDREPEDFDAEAVKVNEDYRMSIYYSFINKLLLKLNCNDDYQFNLLQKEFVNWNEEISSWSDESDEIRKYLYTHFKFEDTREGFKLFCRKIIINIGILYLNLQNLICYNCTFTTLNCNLDSIYVYHGIRYRKSEFRNQIKNLKQDQLYALPIFISTSLDLEFAKNWVNNQTLTESDTEYENTILCIKINKEQYNIFPYSYIGSSTITPGNPCQPGDTCEIVVNLGSILKFKETEIDEYNTKGNGEPFYYYYFEYVQQPTYTVNDITSTLNAKLDFLYKPTEKPTKNPKKPTKKSTEKSTEKPTKTIKKKTRSGQKSQFGITKKNNIKLISMIKLKKGKKKYEAKFEITQPNGKISKKTIKFGAQGMSDYTIHKDKERRERYINRHKKDLRTNNPIRAGFLSMYILWNKPTFKSSLTDYKKRLNIYNKTGKFPLHISGSKILKFNFGVPQPPPNFLPVQVLDPQIEEALNPGTVHGTPKIPFDISEQIGTYGSPIPFCLDNLKFNEKDIFPELNEKLKKLSESTKTPSFGKSKIPDNVKNKDLYQKIKNKISKDVNKKGRRWGAYDSGRLVKEYKEKGGKYTGSNKNIKKSNLSRWYKEKWIDACAWPKKKSCGRVKSKEKIAYCRPSIKVDSKTPKLIQELSKKEIKSRCSKKKKNPKKIIK